jgi:CRISPR-associated Csx3 family protein
MTVAEFSINRVNEKIVVLEVRLTRPITPEDLREIELPDIHGNIALIVSGRMPLWLSNVIVQRYSHLVAAVAVYDPKLSGGVVVTSYNPEFQIGQVIPIDLPTQR